METTPNELQRLADELRRRPMEEQIDFARTSLEEMIATYLEAIEATRADRGSPGDRQKVASWRAGAYGFVDRLRLAVDAIDSGASVEVFLGPLRTAQLLVDGRPILIEAPRPREALAMETRIVTAHCLTYDCGFLEAEPPEVHVPTETAERSWRFDEKEGAVYVLGDDIVCLYADAANRTEKESLCQRLGAEARHVLAALAQARAAAIVIDWDSIHIDGSEKDEMQAVVLNSRGQYLELSLPQLAASKDLSELVFEWVRARLAGRPEELRLPGANVAPSRDGRQPSHPPASTGRGQP